MVFVHLAALVSCLVAPPATASPLEPLIWAFGDSLTAGYGLPPAQGFVPRLQAALRAGGSPGVHLGVGGKNVRAQGFYRHLGFTELRRFADGGALLGLRL